MPPYRNAQHGGFGSLGSDSVPSKPAVAQDPQEEILWGPRMDNEHSAQAGYPDQDGMADIFEEMARSMREAFPASFEGVSANPSTGAAQSEASTGGTGESATAKPPAEGPNVVDPENGSGFSFHFAFTPAEHGLPREAPPPPLFNEHERRPYGFNWNGSTAEGADHPGSTPFNSSRDSEPNHHYHHHHEHQRSCPAWTPRGRFTPYGRGGPPPHFHHHHHRPPQFGPGNFPFGFGGPFDHDGPFGFRGRWNHRPPPSPLDEHFAKARQQQQQSWQNVFEKMEEMRTRMHGAGYFGHDYYGSRRGGPHHHHTSRGGHQSSSRGQHHSYGSGPGGGGPPPHPRSRSTPNPTTSFEDIPRPRRVDIAKAWETYSAQWKKLTATDAPSTIQLSEIPWPVIVDTSKMKTLTEMASTVTATTVGGFILSAKHSPDVSNKKRIHQALRLYHPDRFETAVVARVEEHNQKAVRELGEVVAKCLNKLLEKEN